MVRFLSAVLATIVVASAAHTETPAQTPPGSILFATKNLTFTTGTFHSWRIVHAAVDSTEPPRGGVEVEVDVASIDTGIKRRDRHLRSADFFEVERYPTARVRVHSPVADGESDEGRPRYRAKFDIRIRDVEKTLEGTFERISESPPTFEGEVIVNRLDFGVGSPPSWWNPGSIGREVQVHFSASIPE